MVEPGTPKGFALIRAVRDELLAAGAHIAAPCPGSMACPMVDPDWCHFAARVERSSLHRRLKGGELGYEDEKYSYVAFTREAMASPAARILRRPQHHPGWIELRTCAETGLATRRITKRDREAFREARQRRLGRSDWPVASVCLLLRRSLRGGWRRRILFVEERRTWMVPRNAKVRG